VDLIINQLQTLLDKRISKWQNLSSEIESKKYIKFFFHKNGLELQFLIFQII